MYRSRPRYSYYIDPKWRNYASKTKWNLTQIRRSMRLFAWTMPVWRVRSARA
jgi:hypothetical protein